MTEKRPLNADQVAWIEALESKKYKRSRQDLATYSVTKGVIGHCCLGVFAAIQPGVEFKGTPMAPSSYPTRRCPYIGGEPVGNEYGAYLTNEFASRIDISFEEQRHIGRFNDGMLLEEDPYFDFIIPKIKEIWRAKGYDC